MIGYAEDQLRRLREMRGLAGAASFSDCGRYRYWLGRRWDFVAPSRVAVFVMNNPSKAGADRNDQTVARCTGFAKRLGCTGIEVVNQRAWIATDPRELLHLPDSDADGGSIGPDNANFINRAIQGGAPSSTAFVIVAWGESKLNRYPTPKHFCGPASYLPRGAVIRCLGVTRRGTPRHPSRLAYETALVPWESGL